GRYGQIGRHSQIGRRSQSGSQFGQHALRPPRRDVARPSPAGRLKPHALGEQRESRRPADPAAAWVQLFVTVAATWKGIPAVPGGCGRWYGYVEDPLSAPDPPSDVGLRLREEQ